MHQPIINLTDYTVADHLLFGIGCFLWVIVYIIVLINIRKYQFIEIPLIAITVNFAWETLWSWVFVTNMGSLYVWGYRAWFFLDCFIVYNTFRYGFKQLQSGFPPKSLPVIFVGAWGGWMILLYFFSVKFDIPQSGMGGYGGYWCNLIMSAIYIPFLIRTNDLRYFSFSNAILKGLGTFLVTLFCINHKQWRGEWFLYSLGIATALLDLIYIVTIFKLKKKAHVRLG
ncbi:MAG TPA: hypothetical protein PLP14_07960 [Chitinophagaceae bacterium]|nr:hypothetical protein [Chitinophagaceae bacterium]